MNDIFKALSSSTRRDILIFLKSGEKSATEISDCFSLSKPTISHHLKILKECDLISYRREKNTIYYYLKTSVLEDLTLFLFDLKGGS